MITTTYFIVTVLVEYCRGPGNLGDETSAICMAVVRSSAISKLYQSNSLMLTMYTVLVDYILGLIMFLVR